MFDIISGAERSYFRSPAYHPTVMMIRLHTFKFVIVLLLASLAFYCGTLFAYRSSVVGSQGKLRLRTEGSRLSKGSSQIRRKGATVYNVKTIERLIPGFKKQVWQPVKNSSLRVFSAFYDPRSRDKTAASPSIRILGYGDNNFKSASVLRCNVFFHGGEVICTSHVKVKFVDKGCKGKICNYFFICPLALNEKSVPIAVSLSVVENCNALDNLLAVHYNFKKSANRRPLAVCMPPIHQKRYRGAVIEPVKRLVKALELQYLMGADYIVLYLHSIAPSVGRALEVYKKEGRLKTVTWTWRGQNGVEPSSFGQNLAANDCLQRLMFRFRNVLFAGMNDLLVPKRNMTLVTLLHQMEKQNVGDYQINTFSYENEKKRVINTNIFSHIVKPSKVVSIEQSGSIRLVSHYKSNNLPQEVASVYTSTDTISPNIVGQVLDKNRAHLLEKAVSTRLDQLNKYVNGSPKQVKQLAQNGKSGSHKQSRNRQGQKKKTPVLKFYHKH